MNKSLNWHLMNHRIALGAPKSVSLGRYDLWLLLGAFVALYAPTYATLDRVVWIREGQGHGPILAALIGWLIWTRLPKFLALNTPPNTFAGSVTLLLGAVMYVLGRSQDLMALDTFSQVFFLGSIALLYRGWAGLRLMWFPLFFFIFIIPLPTTFVDSVTAPLKMAVSVVSENVLHAAGFPIGREGVMLVIGPYKLLVADACAGINSIFALEAVGVFYMSIAGHTNRLRNILLATFILPISFISNVTRVCTLVLITYYFGDEAGQGFVHGFAGILLFVVATLLTLATDSLLGLFLKDGSQNVRTSPSHAGSN